MKAIRHYFAAILVLASVAFCGAQGVPLKKPTLNLEAAMRAWQERWVVETGADQILGISNPNGFQMIPWPARQSDGLRPGPYPEDWFYVDDMQTPGRAASLVVNFAAAISTSLGRSGESGGFGVIRRFDPLWANWSLPPPEGPNTSSTAGHFLTWLGSNGNWARRDPSAAAWSSDFSGINKDNFEAKFQILVDHWLNTPCRPIWRYSPTTGSPWSWTHNIPRADFAGPTCASCTTVCTPATCSAVAEDNSFLFAVSLGQGSEGNLGTLQLRTEVPGPELGTPYGLAVRLQGRIYSGNAGATSIAPNESYAIYDESSYPAKGYSLLRQVVFPQGLADIVADNNTKYRIYFYDAANRGSLSGKFYTPNSANAYKIVTIENPDHSTSVFNRLDVTLSTGEAYHFVYGTTQDGVGWALSTGTSADRKTESDVSTWISGTGNAIGHVRQGTHAIVDGNGNVASKVRNKSQIFPWNANSTTGVPFTTRNRRDELIETVVDPDAGGKQLKTTYRYYDDVATNNPNYGRLKQVEHDDGSWERYEYDAQGRVTRTFSTFKDAPAPAAAAGTPSGDYRLTEVVYGSAPSQTITDSIVTGGTTTVVGRRFREIDDTSAAYSVTRDIQATNANAAYGDANNLVTTSRRLKTGKFIGSPERVVNADGTVTLYTYNYANGGNTTVRMASGVPNNANPLAATDVTAGTRTTTVTNPQGQQLSRTTVDAASGLTIEDSFYFNPDSFGRWRMASHLGDLVESRTYDCCGLASETDRAGIRTVYTYDSLHRVVRETRYVGDSSTMISDQGSAYDAAGRRLSTTRYVTGPSADPSTPASILVQSLQYNIAGQLIATTNLRGTTTIVEDKTAEGRRRTTTTLPDLSTDIRVYRRDGSLESVSGTSVAPAKSDAGIDAGGFFTKSIRIGDGGAETEWAKSYVDFAGRSSRTVLADSAEATSSYNPKGQLASTVQPPDSSAAGATGVTTLFVYNSLGQVETTALDLNHNGVVDYAGTDRLTRTVRDVANVTHDSVAYSVVRSTTSVWAGASDSSSTVSVSETSVDGLRNWQTQHGLTSSSTTALSGSGARTVVSRAPDGTTSTQTFSGDRLATSISSAGGVQLVRVDLGYDGYGRVESSTDARNGTTGYTYYNDGLVKTVTTPDPDTTNSDDGYEPQTTEFVYDNMGRQASVTLPDSGVVNNRYWPTGQLWRTWGARTVPQEQNYDVQGRLRTLATWTDFVDESTFASTTGKSVTTWNYHPQRGWLESKRYNDNHGPDYIYYPSGQLKQRTWARGVSATYSYNAAGELAGIVYSDPTAPVTFGYDRLGRQSPSSDAAGALTRGYKDLTGMPVDETYGAGPLSGLSVSHGYDPLLRPNALNVPAAAYTVSMTYRDGSRLDTISAAAGGLATSHAYTYQANSGLIDTLFQKRGSTTVLTTTRNYDLLNRLSSIVATPSVATPTSTAYGFNNANQRVKATEADGKYWEYAYDALGQVTDGTKRLTDGSPLLGHAFGYLFDTIGNRASSTANGAASAYTLDAAGLNQYLGRTVPGSLDLTGSADPAASVVVNLLPVERQGDAFHLQLPIDNTVNPVWQPVEVVAARPGAGSGGADAIEKQTGRRFVPRTPESFSYDLDGNLTSDGRWTFTWDAENRLIALETQASAVTAGTPRQKLEFAYDAGGRRFSKKVFSWNGSAWVLAKHSLFLYDGWNMVAELNGLSSNAVVRSCIWGLDLSGSMQGAGGVGGLLAINVSAPATATYFPSYDGNGNVVGNVDASNGSFAAHYEYGPFGELLRADGLARDASPFHFSTKFEDEETGLAYYGHRYYNPATGRWLSRDPIEEQGGANLYGMVGNDTIDQFDLLGLAILLRENDIGFNLSVINGYREIVGDAGRIGVERIDGPDGQRTAWKLVVRSENPDSKCNKCWQLLKQAIEAPFEIRPLDRAGSYQNHPRGAILNAEGETSGLVRRTWISPYVAVEHPEVEPGYVYSYRDRNNYTINIAPFAVVLWHESIGHNLLGLRHPSTKENYYGTRDPYEDETIAIENLARECLRLQGKQILDRYPKYYRRPGTNWWQYGDAPP